MIWLAYVIPYGVLFLLTYLIAPLLAMTASRQEGMTSNNKIKAIEPRLPSWLAWFQTPDNSLFGDNGWKDEHCIDYWNCYWGMVGWLWRNPCYGISYSIFAAKITPDLPLTVKGNPNIKDNQNGIAGYCFTRVGKYWNLYWIVPIWEGRCFRLNVGWKLQTFAQNPDRLKTPTVAMFCLSPRYAKFFPA